MSLALTGRTFLDLWDWWDCLSKSELIKLSWFSAQPSMNLHSSRYPNQTVFRIQITKLKKKTMFIQMLEGLHQDDAEVLMAIKNKNLNNIYKGLTSQMVKETFGWNDDFVRIA